ncbi:MAG: peptidylprolyl isomerase [Planctomycetota bacterium]
MSGGSRRRGVRGGVIVAFACASWLGCDAPVRWGAPTPFGPIGDASRIGGSSPATAAGVGAPASSAANSSASPERLVVLGETLTVEDVWKGRGKELEAKASLATDDFRRQVAERSAQVVTDKVAESLLYQRAAARVDEAMGRRIDQLVDTEIRKTVSEDFGGIQRRYERRLETEGRTLDEVRKAIRRQFVITAYLDGQIRPKVAEPTRDQLRAAFIEGREQWRTTPRRSMSLIDVRVSALLSAEVTDPTREQLEEARAQARVKAQAALAELRSGAAFADLARRCSNDSHAQDGGRWGWVTRDGVRERFVPALQALERLNGGEISEVVETQDSFFLVRCDELQPGFEPDFQNVQPQLADLLFRREYNGLIAQHVEELRGKAGLAPEDMERFHAAAVAHALASIGMGPS